MQKPKEVCHEDLWDHMDEVRAHVMKQMWSIVGVFTLIGGAALAWGVNERSDQIESNRVAAERYGAAAERQLILIERLDEIRSILREVDVQMDAHAKDPYAHPATRQDSAR